MCSEPPAEDATQRRYQMPIIETRRLLLRPFTLEDTMAYLSLNSDPALVRYSGEPAISTLEEAQQRLSSRMLHDYAVRGYGRHACVDKESGALIGFAGIKYAEDIKHHDIGFRILSEHQGQGLITEACRALLPWAFDAAGQGLELEKVVAGVEVGNAASVRVLEKLGFQQVQTIDWEGQQVIVFELQAEAWRRGSGLEEDEGAAPLEGQNL